MIRKALLGGVAGLALAGGAAFAHPLDGFSGEEYQKINEILRASDLASDATLYPLIELIEPPKAALEGAPAPAIPVVPAATPAATPTPLPEASAISAVRAW